MSVWTWGFGKLGQLGNGETDTCHTPVKPKLASRIQCTHVHSGGYFTAVITSDGRLYTFGCGKYGRLGTNDEEDRREPVEIVVHSPESKERSVEFRKVSCGIWHGGALTTDNDLYMWGYPNALEEAGCLGSSNCCPPQIIRGPFNHRVAGLSCGNNFTLLWTTDGEAFSWGCGRNGVLGHGSVENVRSPTLIACFKGKHLVTFMHAGFAHSGAVTGNGEVFMFGKATDGALGIGNGVKDITTPTHVTSFKGVKVEELSCSAGEKHGHTLFVTEKGSVFSCGDGYKGKLGLGDQESRHYPTQIPQENFQGESITHVAAGGIHSAAVSAQGHVFTWGCGSDGRLGHPDGKGHRYLFRSDTPRIVDALVGKGKAAEVGTSYYHTVALLS